MHSLFPLIILKFIITCNNCKSKYTAGIVLKQYVYNTKFLALKLTSDKLLLYVLSGRM